ncbi:MAG: phage terminase large subunit family protein [Phenylobacterium sp.]|nr:phage terminase large subunit family protein [Phenylobacterium sp.]
MSDVAYADAGRMVLDALSGILPPERLNVPAWAAKKRWMNNAGGGIVGQYSHEVAPYTFAPSEDLTKLEYLNVALVGPGQVAKTVVAENLLGYSIDVSPANLLWYMQTDLGIESYVKGRINPFIDDHECLWSKQGKRPADDSLHFKKFTGMQVEFLAFGPSTIINKSAPLIVADEIDNYQWLGDVKPVLDVRRQTFGRQSMVLAMSHPDMARGLNPARDWTSGIMAYYADSTRGVWYWECPHCGCWSSPAPIAARPMTLEFPRDPDVPLDVVAAEAHLLCPNSCVVEDHHRKAMNLGAFRHAHGGWIREGQELTEGGELRGEIVPRETSGYWITGTMSPFVIGGIGTLARNYVKAQRALEAGDEEGEASLRQVVVKQWGVPYSPKRAVGSVEATELVDRCEAELKLQTVAHGVRVLTVGVDCQAWGWEYLVRGWGRGGESWIVDHGRIAGMNPKTGKPVDPATSPDEWDLLLDVFGRAYPLADGSGRVMKIRAMAYDSQGAPGVATQAYAAFKRWRRAGKARMIGQIGKRDVWTIIPTKGSTKLSSPRLIVSYPDTAREANKAAARGEVPQGQFNPNLFKDALTGHLKAAEPGDWYVHFPAGLKAPPPADVHPWFEQLCAEHQLPSGAWEKIRSGARNEVLDLMVLNHVVAHLHGLHRIDWTSPPGWVADWDDNPAVFHPEQMAAEAAAAAADPTSAAERIAAKLASGG